MSFRGASADAFRELSSSLRSAAAGAGDATAVGQELFSVAHVLRTEPALRRVATDQSVEDSAKRSLVEQLFSDRVSAPVLQLLGSAVARRWTRTRDLADALESLGVEAVVRSASADASRLSDELFAVREIIKNSPELRDALSDPVRSTEDKRTLVRELLEGKVLPATVILVNQALAGSYRTVGVALEAYQQVAADVHGENVATVRVAHPLPESEQRRLGEALARQYGRDVHLNVVVDPDVIGGIKVEIGDDVIDGTVASRLDEARRNLAG